MNELPINCPECGSIETEVNAHTAWCYECKWFAHTAWDEFEAFRQAHANHRKKMSDWIEVSPEKMEALASLLQ